MNWQRFIEIKISPGSFMLFLIFFLKLCEGVLQTLLKGYKAMWFNMLVSPQGPHPAHIQTWSNQRFTLQRNSISLRVCVCVCVLIIVKTSTTSEKIVLYL